MIERNVEKAEKTGSINSALNLFDFSEVLQWFGKKEGRKILPDLAKLKKCCQEELEHLMALLQKAGGGKQAEDFFFAVAAVAKEKGPDDEKFQAPEEEPVHLQTNIEGFGRLQEFTYDEDGTHIKVEVLHVENSYLVGIDRTTKTGKKDKPFYIITGFFSMNKKTKVRLFKSNGYEFPVLEMKKG